MALMDRIRNELIDIIEWIDDNHHAIVWRFPRFHNQIKTGAQLLVRPGQTAVFVSQGKVADVFGPGQYTLETKNLPVLSTILGWKYGFDSPFKAEIYFVNTTTLTDLKWGTPKPVIMRDPDFGPVRVRAFGTYTLRAVDPQTLLEELVGTDSLYEADEISELLRSIVNSSFADVVASSGFGVLDLAARYDELSVKLRETVAEQIDDEFGLEIPQLFIVNISLPSEVEKALDARSSMGVLGDMQRYQAFQLANAMPVAAENPAGGIAGAGLGVGMGMAMAGPMMQHATSAMSPAAAQPAAAAAPPPPLESVWHVAQGSQATGPFTLQQVIEAIAAGQLGPETRVWSAGMAAWEPAGQVPQLRSRFGAMPPPLG